MPMYRYLTDERVVDQKSLKMRFVVCEQPLHSLVMLFCSLFPNPNTTDPNVNLVEMNPHHYIFGVEKTGCEVNPEDNMAFTEL